MCDDFLIVSFLFLHEWCAELAKVVAGVERAPRALQPQKPAHFSRCFLRWKLGAILPNSRRSVLLEVSSQMSPVVVECISKHNLIAFVAITTEMGCFTVQGFSCLQNDRSTRQFTNSPSDTHNASLRNHGGCGGRHVFPSRGKLADLTQV
jgi:hypothetical protein